MDDPVTEKHRQLAEEFLQDLLLQSRSDDEINLLVEILLEMHPKSESATGVVFHAAKTDDVTLKGAFH